MNWDDTVAPARTYRRKLQLRRKMYKRLAKKNERLQIKVAEAVAWKERSHETEQALALAHKRVDEQRHAKEAALKSYDTLRASMNNLRAEFDDFKKQPYALLQLVATRLGIDPKSPKSNADNSIGVTLHRMIDTKLVHLLELAEGVCVGWQCSNRHLCTWRDASSHTERHEGDACPACAKANVVSTIVRAKWVEST